MFFNPIFTKGGDSVILPAGQFELTGHPVGALSVAGMNDYWADLHPCDQELDHLQAISRILDISHPGFQVMVEGEESRNGEIWFHLPEHLTSASPGPDLPGGVHAPKGSNESLQPVRVILQHQDHVRPLSSCLCFSSFATSERVCLPARSYCISSGFALGGNGRFQNASGEPESPRDNESLISFSQRK